MLYLVQVLIVDLTSLLDAPELFHRDLTLSWRCATGNEWPATIDLSHQPADLCADAVSCGACSAINRSLHCDLVGTLLHNSLYSLVEVIVLSSHVQFNLCKAVDGMRQGLRLSLWLSITLSLCEIDYHFLEILRRRSVLQRSLLG